MQYSGDFKLPIDFYEIAVSGYLWTVTISVIILADVEESYLLWYNSFVTAPRQVKEGGGVMDFVLSFIVAVAAGVVCHLIIKWLDSDK